MVFPIPSHRNRDTIDVRRDERKRQLSPGSFFFFQGQSQVLSTGYFKNERLAASARDGIVMKHLHRIHLALFGQLMASFKFFSKDFVSKGNDIPKSPNVL